MARVVAIHRMRVAGLRRRILLVMVTAMDGALVSFTACAGYNHQNGAGDWRVAQQQRKKADGRGSPLSKLTLAFGESVHAR